MQWLRLYHDTVDDHKWRLVSNESGQPVGNVLAVWLCMLVNASAADERGTLEGWQDRYIAAHLGYPTDAVREIREAMQGVVLDGDRLTGWENRQRMSDDAAEVKRKQREKTRQAPPDGGGAGGTAQGKPMANGHVHGQTEDVHGQNAMSMDSPHNPSRATDLDLDLEKEGSVANATGGGAPSGRVISHPATAQGELFGQVLLDLCAACPKKDPDDIRSQLGKALSHFGADAALALARQALTRAEPWRYLWSTINERIKAAGGRPGCRPLEAGAAEFLELFERKKAELS